MSKKVTQSVEGLKSACNTVQLLLKQIYDPSAVVFFHGDIQCFIEEIPTRKKLSAEFTEAQFLKYSIDKSCESLAAAFPQSSILAIRSSRCDRTFTFFDNFCPSNVHKGTVDFRESNQALEHLSALVTNAWQTNKLPAPKETTIVGFSKGCTVLTHLALGLRFYPIGDNAFVDSIRRLVFLDSGHAGCAHFYPTNPGCMAALRERGVRVDIHVTPFQLKRANVGGAQKQTEIECLQRELGGLVRVQRHFWDEPICMEMHFKVIDAFSPN